MKLNSKKSAIILFYIMYNIIYKKKIIILSGTLRLKIQYLRKNNVGHRFQLF